MAAEALLDGESEALTRKASELALAGDTTALRLCLDRVLPPRRERQIAIEFPKLTTAADASIALSQVGAAVTDAGSPCSGKRLAVVARQRLHIGSYRTDIHLFSARSC